MKKLIAAVLTSLAAFGAQASVIVSFTPAKQHAQVGETVSIDMSISGLGGQIVSGFDLNFLFNSTVLSLLAVDGHGAEQQLGQAFGVPPLLVFDSTANGNIGVQASALADDATVAANQANAFLLFHFDLLADADGVTNFSLGSDPDFERNFVGLNFLTLSDVTVLGACVAVGSGSCDATSLPEPSSLPLALLSLSGLGLASTRRRS